MRLHSCAVTLSLAQRSDSGEVHEAWQVLNVGKDGALPELFKCSLDTRRIEEAQVEFGESAFGDFALRVDFAQMPLGFFGFVQEEFFTRGDDDFSIAFDDAGAADEAFVQRQVRVFAHLVKGIENDDERALFAGLEEALRIKRDGDAGEVLGSATGFEFGPKLLSCDPGRSSL